MASIQQVLQEAMAHQQAGRLTEAEAQYREILARDDRQPDAWHLLGTIAQQIGDSATAVDLISHAIELAPQNASFHCNLGNALLGLGRVEDAEASYRQAISRKADFPLAHFNLGRLLASTGRPNDAAASFHRAIQLQPDFADAHYNLALIHQNQRSWVAAISGYQRTLIDRKSVV